MTVFRATEKMNDIRSQIEDSSTVSARKGCWYSIVYPRARLCSQSVGDYFLGGRRSAEKTNQLRKHLFSMGWKIERKDDIYRYISHDGVCYYSLPKVCQHLQKMQGFTTEVHEKHVPSPRSLQGKQCIVNNNCVSDSRLWASDHFSDVVEEKQVVGTNSVPAVGNLVEMPSSSLGIGQEDQCIGYNHSLPRKNIQLLRHSGCSIEEEEGIKINSDVYGKKSRLKRSNEIFVEKECCPQAVIDYCKLESRKRNFEGNDSVDMKQLILKAKMHLSFEGWKFWYIYKANRRELRYCSPKNKLFGSLVTACRAWMKDEMIADKYDSVSASKSLNDNQFSLVPYTEFEESSFGLGPFMEELLYHQANACSIGKGSLEELPVASSCSRKRRSTVDDSTDSQNQKHSKKSRVLLDQGSIFDESNTKHVFELSKRPTKCNAILSMLIDNGVVLPGQEVSYLDKRDHPMAKGQITYEGIKCNCCSKVYGLSNFGVHAGSSYHRPAANIFLQDGRSLLDCQLQLAGDGSDSICSVCYDGGELLLCESCPSVFHLSCVGLEDIPQEEWYCPSCRCGICGKGGFNGDSEHYTEKTVIYCDQCNREYHAGCLREKELADLKRCPKGNWFCSTKCSKIFACLRELVGKINPTGVEGLSWTILRSEKENRCTVDTFAVDSQSKHHRKLLAARRLLHECFERMIDCRTNRETITDVVFSKESDLNRTNYSGFYTMLLERKNVVVSVATIRIFSEKVAEMPLIGTSYKYRRQGMCRLFMTILEKMLSGLGVERLLVPSAPSLLEMWTGSFGFTKITGSERSQFLQHTYLEFLGTTLCQKLLTASTRTEMEPRVQVSDGDNMGQ